MNHNMHILLGVGFAISAGLSFNLSYLLQKIAINRIGAKSKIMSKAIKNPIWLVGFFLQFVVGGAILYPLAQLYIGPSLVPGLLASGMIVLAIGSAFIMKEHLSFREKIGVCIIIVAVTCIGLSRLVIRMSMYDFFSTSFIVRLSVFTVLYGALMVVLLFSKRKSSESKGFEFITVSGLCYALSNLWLSIVIGLGHRLTSGHVHPSEIIFFSIAGVITGTTSILAIPVMQKAFQMGKVSTLIPFLQIPTQTTPIILYFFVFKLQPPTLWSIVLGTVGVILIIVGAFLLSNRQRRFQPANQDLTNTSIILTER